MSKTYRSARPPADDPVIASSLSLVRIFHSASPNSIEIRRSYERPQEINRWLKSCV